MLFAEGLFDFVDAEPFRIADGGEQISNPVRNRVAGRPWPLDTDFRVPAQLIKFGFDLLDDLFEVFCSGEAGVFVTAELPVLDRRAVSSQDGFQ